MSVLDWPQVAEHLVGAAAVSIPLYLLYLFSGGTAIGGGDIKLMGADGIFCGLYTWLCDSCFENEDFKGRAYAGNGTVFISGNLYYSTLGK